MKIFITLLMLLAAPAFAGFSVAYHPPQTNDVAQFAQQLKNHQVLEKMASLLNRYVSIQSEVPIIAKSCGQVNAYYSPASQEVSICYELLADHATKLINKYGRSLSREQITRILSSDLTFVLLHEVGHSLFHLHQVPVLGQEEDAADKFAAFLLLNTNGDRVLQDAPLFMPLFKFPWYEKIMNSASIYGDEHALSEQRMANLICLGFGKSPNAFREAVMAIRLPQRRAARCANEFDHLNKDVQALLGSALLFGGPRIVTAQASEPTPEKDTSGEARFSRAKLLFQYQSVPTVQLPEPSTLSTVQNDPISLLNQYRCYSCHAVDADRKLTT